MIRKRRTDSIVCAVPGPVGRTIDIGVSKYSEEIDTFEVQIVAENYTEHVYVIVV